MAHREGPGFCVGAGIGAGPTITAVVSHAGIGTVGIVARWLLPGAIP